VLATCKHQGISLHPLHAGIKVHLHTLLRQCLHHRPSGPGIIVLQDFWRATPQVDSDGFACQAVGHGHGQLHAAGAAADNRNAMVIAGCPRQHPAPELLPALPQSRHRLYRYRMGTGTGHRIQFRLGADIDADQVIVDGRPSRHGQASLLGIEGRHFGGDKARARPLAQAGQVDMGLFEAVVSRHQSGQHAGIRRVAGGGNQGDAQALDGLHRQHAQGQSVTVPTPHKHQVPVNFCLALHPRTAPPGRPRHPGHH
jgi:hypothetical protein